MLPCRSIFFIHASPPLNNAYASKQRLKQKKVVVQLSNAQDLYLLK